MCYTRGVTRPSRVSPRVSHTHAASEWSLSVCTCSLYRSWLSSTNHITRNVWPRSRDQYSWVTPLCLANLENNGSDSVGYVKGFFSRPVIGGRLSTNWSYSQMRTWEFWVLCGWNRKSLKRWLTDDLQYCLYCVKDNQTILIVPSDTCTNPLLLHKAKTDCPVKSGPQCCCKNWIKNHIYRHYFWHIKKSSSSSSSSSSSNTVTLRLENYDRRMTKRWTQVVVGDS